MQQRLPNHLNSMILAHIYTHTHTHTHTHTPWLHGSRHCGKHRRKARPSRYICCPPWLWSVSPWEQGTAKSLSERDPVTAVAGWWHNKRRVARCRHVSRRFLCTAGTVALSRRCTEPSMPEDSGNFLTAPRDEYGVFIKYTTLISLILWPSRNTAAFRLCFQVCACLVHLPTCS
jgi:hypothetical protein